MSKTTIDLTVLTDLSWWHWALTVPLLAAHASGLPWAIEAVIGLCIVMSGYYLVRLHQIKPYPVQLRLAFLALLLLGLVPALGWIHWVQLAGTTAVATIGYCLLGRLLNLLPFNRTRALTLAFVFQTFFQDPCAGGLVAWSSQPTDSVTACCSQRSAPCGIPQGQPSK